jgi:hypothetical protein
MTAARSSSHARRALLLCLASLALPAILAAPASAAPIWDVQSSRGPTVLHPGSDARFYFEVRNLGDSASSGLVTFKDKFPPGVKVTGSESEGWACVGAATVTCFSGKAVAPRGIAVGGLGDAGYAERIVVDVEVGPGTAPGVYENTATVSGGGAAAAGEDTDTLTVGAGEAGFGMVPGSFAAELFNAPYLGSASPADTVRQAASHPFEMRVGFDLNLKWGEGPSEGPFTEPDELIRTVRTTLPAGLIGNPEATPKCAALDFLTNPPANAGAKGNGTGCPPETQVGVLDVQAQFARELPNPGVHTRVPVYNLVPPAGQLADLAFNVNGLVVGHIFPSLDPAKGYAIRSTASNVSSVGWVRQARFTLWGVPADPVHDNLRFDPEGTPTAAYGASSTAEIRPFLTLPADCLAVGRFSQTVESWQHQGVEVGPDLSPAEGVGAEGCEDRRIRFEPKIAMQPTSREAGGPTGLDVSLEVPQREDAVEDAADLYDQSGDVQAIATPPLKKVVVTLPEGMTANPSVAQGLASCSPKQIGIDPDTGVPDDAPVRCPAASQYGTLTLKSPALPGEIAGRVFIAKQEDNPFGSLLALYLAIDDEDLGLRVKLPGRVDLDPATGQITTTFDDLPQLPASEVTMEVKGGLRAGLVNPQTCGTKTIEASFYSWHDPDTPIPASGSYEITHGPGGTPCFDSLAERPFEPSFLAGVLNPVAGAFSPLELQLTRSDTDQDLVAAEGSPPPGLTASLQGAGRCSEAQIAAAMGRGAPGEGQEELDRPSCPASSLVGTVDAGAGTGQVLTYVEGRVYLAGPYKGAPLSGVAIVPAVAGPFDLGTIVARAPAYLDPRTAEITLRTDPLPQIVNGIPVRVRDIRVHLDRPGFSLNPTSCEEKSFAGTLWSAQGKHRPIATRFQVGDCASLGFKPRLGIRLRGGVRRGAFPALRAVYAPRPGQANLRDLVLRFPRSAFIEQGHFRTICTRVAFAAGAGHGTQCPNGSVYGWARAWTPLLDEPLEGPVILRSSSHNLPDAVFVLRGPAHTPIEVEAVVRIDSVKGALRTIVSEVPDVPVSRVVVSMRGGRKGLIVNSRHLCFKPNRNRARITLRAHSGKRALLRPKTRARCGKQGERKRAGRAARISRASRAPR